MKRDSNIGAGIGAAAASCTAAADGIAGRGARVRILVPLVAAAACALAAGCGGRSVRHIALRSTQEDVKPDRSLYTASTQSLLRGSHWLEQVGQIDLTIDRANRGRIVFRDDAEEHALELVNMPMDQLVPRLHYRPAQPPDAFDAFNLMMAEYSRNGVSVPKGRDGDTMAHFESDLEEGAPWTLAGDYAFVPKPAAKPLRVSLINNCLAPGLWEISANDRAGELYHGWFDMPEHVYRALTAEVNRLPETFVRSALQWRETRPDMDLDRLRRRRRHLGSRRAIVVDGTPGFSSQDGRRKMQRGFMMVEKEGTLVPPTRLSDYGRYPAHMSDFVAPGKYSLGRRKVFDLSFLFAAGTVEFHQVEPLTEYDWNGAGSVGSPAAEYIEFCLDLGNVKLLVGNLPLPLLVQQEDYLIHGFGVGVLPAQDFAERRELLIRRGHRPSFAYLLEERDGRFFAINSHASGVEQVFIRCRPYAATPHLDITIAAFERITDLVRYRLPLPVSLIAPAREHSDRYSSPVYLTYRDDNLR